MHIVKTDINNYYTSNNISYDIALGFFSIILFLSVGFQKYMGIGLS